MNSKTTEWNSVRSAEDAIAALVRARDEIGVVSQWLGQRLLLSGADQQMLNQMFADRLLASVHTYLLAVYQQASEAARCDHVEG